MAMRDQAKVACVSVAFNAARLLPRQLGALQRQSRELDEIIVVDNGSTDSTLKLLKEEYPAVTVLDLGRNLGVGGAYSAGIRYAIHEKAYDWVWLLDDDSVPGDDLLERLLGGLEHLNGARSQVGVLAPTPVHGKTKLAYPGLLWRKGWVTPKVEEPCEPVSFVDAVISSGSLVSKAAIEEAGLPRADFFMDFVDFEHCLRLRRHGFLIGVVRDSCMEHAIGSPRAVRFLWHSRTWSDHAPWREYYMSRNQTYTIWHEYSNWKSKLFVVRKLLRHATGILLFGKDKVACLKMMLSGFWDGRAGRLGIRYRG